MTSANSSNFYILNRSGVNFECDTNIKIAITALHCVARPKKDPVATCCTQTTRLVSSEQAVIEGINLVISGLSQFEQQPTRLRTASALGSRRASYYTEDTDFNYVAGVMASEIRFKAILGRQSRVPESRRR